MHRRCIGSASAKRLDPPNPSLPGRHSGVFRLRGLSPSPPLAPRLLPLPSVPCSPALPSLLSRP
eukprot:5024474-Pyramimonas_sp.AAC.1